MNKKIKINFFCKSNHWSRRMINIREIAQRVIKIDDLNFKINNFYTLNLVFVDDKNDGAKNKEGDSFVKVNNEWFKVPSGNSPDFYKKYITITKNEK